MQSALKYFGSFTNVTDGRYRSTWACKIDDSLEAQKHSSSLNFSPDFPVRASTSVHGSPLRNRSPAFLSDDSSIRSLVINFQSIKSEKEEVWWLIESADPTITIGVETWLNTAVYDSEIFPSQYQVYRNDRHDGYGGVIIVVKDSVISDPVDFAPSSETVFVRILRDNNQPPLIVCAAYRRPSSSSDYMDTLCKDIGPTSRSSVL